MCMTTFKDSIGNEHFCNDKVKDMYANIVEAHIHADAICDAMNRFMSATGDVVDLSKEKALIDKAIKSMSEKYNEHALKIM